MPLVKFLVVGCFAAKGGFSAVNARSVAKKLGCSTQPIYFSFKNMDELKTALTELYSAVSATDSRDPIEALLYAEAERAQAAMQQNACDVLLEETLRPIAKARGKEESLQEPEMLAAGFGTVQPCIEATETAPPAQRQSLPDPVIRKHRLDRTAAVILLSIGILLMLWIIAGLLMDMELLPYVDLGYAWFNRQIAPWF